MRAVPLPIPSTRQPSSSRTCQRPSGSKRCPCTAARWRRLRDRRRRRRRPGGQPAAAHRRHGCRGRRSRGQRAAVRGVRRGDAGVGDAARHRGARVDRDRHDDAGREDARVPGAARRDAIPHRTARRGLRGRRAGRGGRRRRDRAARGRGHRSEGRRGGGRESVRVAVRDRRGTGAPRLDPRHREAARAPVTRGSGVADAALRWCCPRPSPTGVGRAHRSHRRGRGPRHGHRGPLRGVWLGVRMHDHDRGNRGDPGGTCGNRDGLPAARRHRRCGFRRHGRRAGRCERRRA